MHERVDPAILDRQTMKYRIIVVMAAILWVGLTYARHCHIGRSIFQSIRAQGAGELRLAEAAAFDWDYVYLFHPYTPRAEVCATLRIDPVVCKVAVRFESWDDNAMSLAFIRGGGAGALPLPQPGQRRFHARAARPADRTRRRRFPDRSRRYGPGERDVVPVDAPDGAGCRRRVKPVASVDRPIP